MKASRVGVGERLLIEGLAQVLPVRRRHKPDWNGLGSLVARLGNGRRVRIYGEMVDVRAARGNYKAACQLEALWNALGRRESFTLFCGYASGHFGDPRTAALARDGSASRS